jgi:hypothetical protein
LAGGGASVTVLYTPPPVAAIALSTNILLFEAVAKQSKQVSINWQVSNEHALIYEVERSDNSLQWQTFSKQQPSSTLNQTSYYSISDEYPGSFAFYRLKITEQSGAVNYSRIVKVFADHLITVNVTAAAVVMHHLPSNAQSIKLYTMNGRCMYNQPVTASELSLNIENLQKGLYLLMIDKGNSRQTFKIMR